MKTLKLVLVLCASLMLLQSVNAESVPGPVSREVDESAIRAVMDKSAADWNRGDLDAFATAYKNSPDIVFVGRQVTRGYAGMLATYEKNYPTPEARGTLAFSNLAVHLLDAHFATVIGNCHLQRTAAGGGNFDCVFSLVFEKTAEGWKIILDHSSAVTAAKEDASARPTVPGTLAGRKLLPALAKHQVVDIWPELAKQE